MVNSKSYLALKQTQFLTYCVSQQHTSRCCLSFTDNSNGPLLWYFAFHMHSVPKDTNGAIVQYCEFVFDEDEDMTFVWDTLNTWYFLPGLNNWCAGCAVWLLSFLIVSNCIVNSSNSSNSDHSGLAYLPTTHISHCLCHVDVLWCAGCNGPFC